MKTELVYVPLDDARLTVLAIMSDAYMTTRNTPAPGPADPQFHPYSVKDH